MSGPLRGLLALLVWLLAAAAGWWWHRPAAAPAVAAHAVGAGADTLAADARSSSLQAMAVRVAAADPMGLNRQAAAATAVPGTPTTAAATANWRLAALVVRGADRYAVLTSGELPPLSLKAGQTLPDGDRIKAVHSHHIEILSPRGRLRTLYLIEP